MPFSDVVKLLRIPFSIFLLPVFLFGLIGSKNIDWFNFFILFILLHFLIYPASNAYNSYMDQDTGSIGGLKEPPKAGKELFYVSLFLDVSGIVLGFIVSAKLALLLAVYSIISRLYSWRVTRLKKYPVLSFIVVSMIQGGYTYMIASMLFSNEISMRWFEDSEHLAGLISSTFMVAALYPITQIYQHEQDKENGDITISYLAGIKGTFVLSGSCFTGAVISLFYFFKATNSLQSFFVMIAFLIPVISYFIFWAARSFRNPSEANFENTMRMNKIASAMLITAFLVIFSLSQF